MNPVDAVNARPRCAEGYARGKRCINGQPTIVQALIPKPHIFAVFLDRKESEIVLDPRRLRKLSETSINPPTDTTAAGAC